MDELVAQIDADLRAAGTPERAAGEKRYLKSDLEFYGATLGAIGRVVRDLVRRGRPHDETIALAEALWSEPIHERRMAAVMALDLGASGLSTDDLGLIERLLRASRTWALVDALSTDVVSRIVVADPAGATPVLDRWATDADFWVRRASLLGEYRTVHAGELPDRFLRRADALLDEREFFIRKAIGWILREAGKRRPGEVAAWLAPRTHRANGVTMREAVKYLPADVGARLMSAYRAKRPAA